MSKEIKRMAFDLDEAHPLAVMRYTYTGREQQGFFDMHYVLELGIVLKGRVKRRFQGYTKTLVKSGLWMAGIWEPHGFEAGEACELLVLVIWPPLVAQMRHPELPAANPLSLFQTPASRRPYAVPKKAAHVIDRLAALEGAASAFDLVRQRLLVTELLLALQERMPAAAKRAPLAAFDTITPAIDLAFRRNELVPNGTAAAACGMSVSGFLRRFKQLMGVSFAQFSLRQRLNRAAHDLRTTDQPLKAIAARYGFTDQSHLHNQFKHHYGRTPREYREA